MRYDGGEDEGCQIGPTMRLTAISHDPMLRKWYDETWLNNGGAAELQRWSASFARKREGMRSEELARFRLGGENKNKFGII